MVSQFYAAGLLACACSIAHADDATAFRQSARTVSPADVTQWSLALLAVLAIFGIVVWLLRKSGGFSAATKTPLALVGGLSLGMRERLVLVKVGDKQLLLGVTPGRIDKLLELEGEQRLFQNQERTDDAQTFAAKLQQVMQGRSDV